MSIRLNGNHFIAHRKKVIDLLKAYKCDKSVILMRGEPKRFEEFSDLEYDFYQDATFYWMTGWKEPNGILVIDVYKKRSILLIPDNVDENSAWFEQETPFDDIINQTGVDEVAHVSDLDKILQQIYRDSHPMRRLLLYPEAVSEDTDDITTLINIIGTARMVKFDWEIECMREASRLTYEGVQYVMKNVHPGMTEKEIEANFLYYGQTHGAEGVCFTTMAPSGTNCQYPHYHKNNQSIKENSLIYLDCGFYYEHYCGDITRTFPASGRFTDIQREMLTDLTLLQIRLCASVEPGYTISDLDSLALEGIFDILKKHGVINENVDYNNEIAYVFFPHSVSHHIGVCVHDLCMFRQIDENDPQLKPGMIISIEPGIYFNRAVIEQAKNNGLEINYDKAFEFCDSIGGMRVEDDVLITNSTPDILSGPCVRMPEDIEALMTN